MTDQRSKINEKSPIDMWRCMRPYSWHVLKHVTLFYHVLTLATLFQSIKECKGIISRCKSASITISDTLECQTILSVRDSTLMFEPTYETYLVGPTAHKRINTSFWLMQTYNSVSKHIFLNHANLMTKDNYMKYKIRPFDS